MTGISRRKVLSGIGGLAAGAAVMRLRRQRLRIGRLDHHADELGSARRVALPEGVRRLREADGQEDQVPVRRFGNGLLGQVPDGARREQPAGHHAHRRRLRRLVRQDGPAARPAGLHAGQRSPGGRLLHHGLQQRPAARRLLRRLEPRYAAPGDLLQQDHVQGGGRPPPAGQLDRRGLEVGRLPRRGQEALHPRQALGRVRPRRRGLRDDLHGQQRGHRPLVEGRQAVHAGRPARRHAATSSSPTSPASTTPSPAGPSCNRAAGARRCSRPGRSA